MLSTKNKKYKVTIEFEISGEVADMVTEEHKNSWRVQTTFA
jgi:hypothetical protein